MTDLDLARAVATKFHFGQKYGRKTSKYFGVSWNKFRNAWRAAVHERVDGKLKQVHLGEFKDADKAYEAVLRHLGKGNHEKDSCMGH